MLELYVFLDGESNTYAHWFFICFSKKEFILFFSMRHTDAMNHRFSKFKKNQIMKTHCFKILVSTFPLKM